MLDEATLEQRLATPEQAVSELQRKVDSKPVSANCLEHLIGSVSDEDAFIEALEYGRSVKPIALLVRAINKNCEVFARY